MINYELKQRWIEALRTGKYPPHRGSSFGPGGSACALGVLLHEAHSFGVYAELPKALRATIIRKNDIWRWSPHRLAWWIDTYVPSEPQELMIPRE